ncbi:unnamed protein product [Lactuca virosa]|uniref:Reverse transcriptase Ty1/copia-type domain-containing protein n=1 Tax=Lactuca virosa TaxID=75947 RepID=A0AAU9NVZ9_9ASTR|nr:unnamed protein product [Lactuca virosa]
MLVYVDDIVLIGNISQAINQVVHNLSKSFAVQYLGALSYFLGIEIHHRPDSIILSKRKYILELLQCAILSESKLVPSPMKTKDNLAIGDNKAFEKLVQYRQIVGALPYVTLSRPNITFAVNKVCQFLHSPTKNQ